MEGAGAAAAGEIFEGTAGDGENAGVENAPAEGGGFSAGGRGPAELNQYLRNDASRQLFSGTSLGASPAELSDDDELGGGGGGPLERGATMALLDRVKGGGRQAGKLLEAPAARVGRLQAEIADLDGVVRTFLRSRGAAFAADGAVAALPDAAAADAAAFFGADPKLLLAELDGLRRVMGEITASEGWQNFLSATSLGSDFGAQREEHFVEEQMQMLVKRLEMVEKDSGAGAGGGAGGGAVGFAAAGSVAAAAGPAAAGPAAAGSAAAGSAAAAAPSTVYELYPLSAAPAGADAPPTAAPGDRSTQRASTTASEILALERRLATLESVLGVDTSSHLSLPFSTLSDALAEVVSRLAVVNPNQLEALSKRLTALISNLDEINLRKERLAAAIHARGDPDDRAADAAFADNETVNKLYETLESAKPTLASLPVITERLRLLKTLHQEAASLTSRLSSLEQQQRELYALQASTEASFAQLKASVTQSVEWARSVVSTLGAAPAKAA